MKGKIGYIDSRKFKVGGSGLFANARLPVIPGQDVHGTLEDFIGVPAVAASGPVRLGTGTWTSIITACPIDQGNVVGGVATFTCGGADNDVGQIIQGVTAGMGAFTPAADKDIYFKARFQHTNLGANQISLFIGLIAPVAAEIIADGVAGAIQNNCIGLVVRDSDVGAGYSFVGRRVAVEDYNALGVVLSALYVTVEFLVSGITSVRVALDGVEIPAGELATANIPIVSLMPAVFLKAGSGVAEVLRVDYVNAIQLR